MSEELNQLQALVDAVCATTQVGELKKLHKQLEALDLLEAADEPGTMQILDRAFARLDARIARLDPKSEASAEVQRIRDTVTST